MRLRVAILGALSVSVSCNKSTDNDVPGPLPASAAGSAKVGSGSGGGFSADLAKEIGPGSGGAKPGEEAPTGSTAAQAGDDPPRAGSAPRTAAGNDPKASGSAGAAPLASDPANAGGDPNAGNAAGADPSVAGGTTSEPSGAAPVPRGSVRVPVELAAIKMSLLPNWDRDVGEAGTFQYVVRIKGTRNTKTFLFHYGYDAPRAPTDHEQYKKYLQETKAMTGEIKDRQRGSAWFLEGADRSGLPAFRYVVLYGGKHLICYGSLYKDADSNRLGDDRDQTVIQAKQICETLAL